MSETDPLADLRDIHLPEPVEAWPPAPGWWLLGLCVLLAVTAGCIWAYRRYQRNAWRREALAELPAPDGVTTTDIGYYSTLNQILKRSARVCHPGAGTDRMSGVSWQRFLCEQAPDLPAQPLIALARSPFLTEAEIPPETAHRLTRDWLRSQKC